MASFNKVILMGNLTRTPELRSIASGTQVTDIGLAMNEAFTDSKGVKQERAVFVDVTVWGKQADTICRWFKKGDPILIEGRLQLDQWQDKQTGQNRSKLKVTADRFSFVGRASGGGNRGGNQSGAPQGGGNQGGGYDGPPQDDSYGGYDGGYATSLPEGGGDEPPF